MDPSIDAQMQPVPLKIGEALVFSLSTVHGSQVNSGRTTRWSSDMRVMHALAPVDLSARPDYYQPLSYSVVTEAAKRYLYENGKETREHVQLGAVSHSFLKTSSRSCSALITLTSRIMSHVRCSFPLTYYKFAAKMVGARKKSIRHRVQ